MIISEINPDLLVCLIKVKSKNAIPILLNRIATTKQLHCIFLSTEYLDYAKKYLTFISESTYLSYVASPSSKVESVRSPHLIVESSLEHLAALNFLLELDPKLSFIVNQANKEYGLDLGNYRIYALMIRSPMTFALCLLRSSRYLLMGVKPVRIICQIQ